MNDRIDNLLPREILAKATSIPNLGIAHAWPVTYASLVIDALKNQPVAILGGDVVEQDDGKWGHVMPNWWCELEKGEPWEDFALRSRRYAVEFLESNYGKEAVLFVLVIQAKPTAAQLAKSHAR